MNWEAIGSIAELIGAAGVIATLAYLAFQVRENTRALSAQSRHALSEFVLQIAQFRTEHADRYARLNSEAPLNEGDREFRFWSHMQLMLHAETYFHHHELGLMPESHWSGYVRYLRSYLHAPGFLDFWAEVGPGFSENFRRWIDRQLDDAGLEASRTRPDD